MLGHVRSLPILVLAASLAVAACSAVDGSAGVDEARRTELAARWRLYLTNDAAWPDAREAWFSGPRDERELLLDNLTIELLRDDAAGRGVATASRSARARRELQWFGGEAVPLLVEGMKGLALRERIDHVALDRLALALVELHAAAELAALVTDAKAAETSVALRLAGIRALAPADEPAVVEALTAALRSDPAWEVRGAAAEALRRRAANGPARAALVAAFADSDGYVRAQAVRALAVGLDPETDGAALRSVRGMLLADPAPQARGAAAEALALYAFDPEAGAALVRALRDPDSSVVARSARALQNVRTGAVQLALVDALESAIQRRDDGLVSELLLILTASVGARPADINPVGWRALVRQRDDSLGR